jgi:quercetin dioxygenase-like cupin family protein
MPNGPGAEVLIGTEDDWPMGVAHVVVPAGGGMPEHDHGASAAMVIALEQPVVIVDVAEGREFEVEPGAVLTIPAGNLAEVRNPADVDVAIMVVFDPPDFTSQLNSWPVDET